MGSQVNIMDGLTLTILVALVPMIQCNPAMEVDVVRSVEKIKLARAVADRDMHKWWAEYDVMMADYQSKRDGMICTEEDKITGMLDAINTQVETVKFGWEQKKEQLKLIRDILEHDDYKNMTGLHTALDEYLTQQDEQAAEEGEHLKVEEAEVAAEKNTLDTHPCPCVWGEWQEWADCSVTCGGGSKARPRVVAKNATNGGDECDGGSTSSTTCGTNPCPIPCEWGTWGEWGECSTICGDGLRDRHRVHAIVAQFGGEECPGEATSDKSCNVLEETRREVAEQKAEIEDLKRQLEEADEGMSGMMECEMTDNQYWSYGDYETIRDISDYQECCRICKEDPECTNFSYGKADKGYANQCFKKRGGSAQGRGEFISSPKDISACSCD